MGRQLAFIHTVTNLIPTFEDLAGRHLPEWEVFNIVDESLLRDTIRTGELSAVTRRRLAGYVSSAVEAGADAIMVTCSSLGPAVDAVVPTCPVRLFRVDEAMADRAIDLGRRIGVLATLSTTLAPTRALIESRAKAKGKTVELVASLRDGAFQALQQGNRDQHDAEVREAFVDIAARVDVVVLAQASMARVLSELSPQALTVPALASPELAIEHMRTQLL